MTHSAEAPQTGLIFFCYQHEAYLDDALDGIVQHCHLFDEIVICDDGSTDRSQAKLINFAENWAASASHPKLILNEGNKGLIWTINNAIPHSSASLLFFASADDVSLAPRFHSTVEIWEANNKPVCAIFGNAQVINEDGRQLGLFCNYPIPVHQKCSNFLRTGGWNLFGFSGAYHRALFERFGPLTSWSFQEDVQLALRALQMDGILYLSDPLVQYRRHATNTYTVQSVAGLRKVYRSTFLALAVTIMQSGRGNLSGWVQVAYVLRLVISMCTYGARYLLTFFQRSSPHNT